MHLTSCDLSVHSLCRSVRCCYHADVAVVISCCCNMSACNVRRSAEKLIAVGCRSYLGKYTLTCPTEGRTRSQATANTKHQQCNIELQLLRTFIRPNDSHYVCNTAHSACYTVSKRNDNKTPSAALLHYCAFNILLLLLLLLPL
jgi:hypothetical protein